jgi:hypothetical protein
MKNICIILFIVLVKTSMVYAQGPVPRINGGFENPSPNIPLNTCGLLSANNVTTGSGWTSLNQDQSPLICHKSVYFSFGEEEEDTHIGVLRKTVEGDTIVDAGLRSLNFNVSGIYDNDVYTLEFDYANLGTVEGYEGDFSCTLEITIQGVQYSYPIPPYDPVIEWNTIKINFCGVVGPLDITISVNINNNAEKMSALIAIDNLEVDNKSGLECVCNDCNSLKLEPTTPYILSGWVKRALA